MRPKKSLGQNFLVDPNYKRKIIDALNLKESDQILEIGAGQGVLTKELAGQCRKLWVIEKDDRLSEFLSVCFQNQSHVTILNQDFLQSDLSFLKKDRHDDNQVEKVVVVGNLPYNIASQIFIRLIENRRYFSELFLMFQKEMGLRFVAQPKTKDYGLLTLWAQIYTDCKTLFHLPPAAFRPRPKVVSSFIYFKIKEKPLLDDKEAPLFWKLMRTLFQQRRKTIVSVLRKKGEWVWERVEKTTRVEELPVKELIELARSIR